MHTDERIRMSATRAVQASEVEKTNGHTGPSADAVGIGANGCCNGSVPCKDSAEARGIKVEPASRAEAAALRAAKA